ncbi:hypothetical protein [Ferruginibacter sp.]
MKNCINSIFILLAFAGIFSSCNTATPEKYFDVAVLNSNLFVGFADDGFFRQLQSPSVKMTANGGTASMKRAEVVAAMIDNAEEGLKKVKGLSATESTKEMLQASQAMYEYILPILKNEYTQLAGLYDNGAANDKIEAQSKAIYDKYNKGFNDLYNKLIGMGKAYAAKNNIPVNWGA